MLHPMRLRPTAPRRSTVRPPWRWAAGGSAVGIMTALVVFAPASWLAQAIAQASHGQVQLHEARGSVWQGSAQLVLTGGRGSTDAVRLPGSVQWKVGLRADGLQVALQAPCCTFEPIGVRVQWLRWNGLMVSVADHHSRWPADLLTGLGTPWNTVQVRGQLSAASQGLQWRWEPGRQHLQGALSLDAINLTSRLSTLTPMGSYRLTLTGGESPNLQLQTLSGSLQLEGQGQWVDQRLRFTGVASAAPDRVEALSNLLNIVGRRDGARSFITLGS